MWRLSWAARWGLACLVVFIILAFVGEDCRNRIADGGTCEGIARTAYEDLGTIALVLLVAGVAGGFLLGRLEDLYHTRPCPRCGERVEAGQMDCPSCEFDFRTVGR